MTDDDKKKSTLKLKGGAAPRGDRAPVRGMSTPKKRPTLAEAQADVLASGATDLKLRLDGANRAASRAVRERLRAGWNA